MAISAAPNGYYNCQASGIMTDARVSTWASDNSVADANYWIKVPNKRRFYVVSSTQLSRRQARKTFLNPNPNTTGYRDADFYVIS